MLLVGAADKIWREACKMGVKCVGEVYLTESKAEKLWKIKTVACHRDDAERVEAISFKRMVALMYEITCKEQRDVDSVTEEFAKLMLRDNGCTKMILESIQGAIVARAQ